MLGLGGLGGWWLPPSEVWGLVQRPFALSSVPALRCVLLLWVLLVPQVSRSPLASRAINSPRSVKVSGHPSSRTQKTSFFVLQPPVKV